MAAAIHAHKTHDTQNTWHTGHQNLVKKLNLSFGEYKTLWNTFFSVEYNIGGKQAHEPLHAKGVIFTNRRFIYYIFIQNLKIKQSHVTLLTLNRLMWMQPLL